MRLLLLILMIALLPLRSWALVVEPSSTHQVHLSAIKKEALLAQPAVLTSQLSSKAEHHCHAAPSSAPEAVLASPHPDTTDPQPTCPTCGDCVLCHSLAATFAPLLPASPQLSNELRTSSGDRFDSALAALSLKPPIS